MQLTAPRLVFPLSVARTFYSQPLTLSGAVAELELVRRTIGVRK
jgi:hypothetical protein